jgi:putative membrane protein
MKSPHPDKPDPAVGSQTKLKKFVQRWLITTVAVLIAAFTVPGIHYDNWEGLLVGTLVLSLLNVFIRPVLTVLSFPLLIATLGLFTIIINAVLLFFVGRMKYFHVDTFGAAIWGAIVIGIVSMILNSLTGTGTARISVRRGTNRKDPPDTGSGPVIDV